jgi:hypothetical protein
LWILHLKLEYSVSVQLGVSLPSATHGIISGETAAPVRVTKQFEAIVSFFDVAIPLARDHYWRFAFLVLFQLSLGTTLAGGQSPAGAIKQFGLLGTWADGPANQYAIRSLTSRGNIELRNDFGPNSDQMVYGIADAQGRSHFRSALCQVLTSDDQIVLDTL